MFTVTNANGMYSGGNRFDHHNNYEADDELPRHFTAMADFPLLCIAILSSSYSTQFNLFSWYRIAKYSHEASV
jgi:hypothetical protein